MLLVERRRKAEQDSTWLVSTHLMARSQQIEKELARSKTTQSLIASFLHFHFAQVEGDKREFFQAQLTNGSNVVEWTIRVRKQCKHWMVLSKQWHFNDVC